MYVKRIQLHNYGPIERLDIELPFNGEIPLPVVLVGENGSGKSILLSHVVNGLLAAKGVAFPGTPEIENDKVYKLRSRSYIKSGSEYYFGRVDFEGSLFVSELWTHREKQGYSDTPEGVKGTDAHAFWEKLSPQDNNKFDTNIIRNANTSKKIEELFDKNCVLYLPHNRFEEPAWLNEDNLKAQAQYMDLKHMQGHTEREVIALSPLRDNQNWLFDLLFDRAVLEIQTRNLNLPVTTSVTTGPLPVIVGYSGTASATYEVALQIVRGIVRAPNVRFGIGRRHNRVVSIVSDVESKVRDIVPNIFQLSSGETSLLNLFLSILRDFDLCGAPFANASEIRGIVVVDEIDLHLHATHQYEVLPNLIKMFPKVQFIVTTHSPLFVLGMQKAFGEDGFGLYRLPQGHQISPEEFSEFGEAYRALTTTRTFNDAVQAAIENSQKPIVFAEGTTDKRYIEKAAVFFGKETVLESLELRDGGGSGKLTKICKDSVLPLTETLKNQVLLLFDCDTKKAPKEKGKLMQRAIPMNINSPVKKGIENLFGKPILEQARQFNSAFFTTEDEHNGTDEDGQPITIPEEWTVVDKNKSCLCKWICDNGTREDFENLQSIFNIIEEALDFEIAELDEGVTLAAD